MNNHNPYPRPLAEHWVCSCFCTNNLYFLIIIFPKPIRGDALPAGGWRGRPRPPPPTPAEKWLLPAGRVPKDVHTINIIRLTRDRRVKDAGEDAVMRVGAGGTRLRGGRGLRVLSLVSDCYALVSIYNLWKWNLLLPFWRTLFRTARSSQFAASTHNSQSTWCLADSQPQPPLSVRPSAVPHLANCRIMFYIAVDNNANKSTIQRIQAAATNRQNKKAPNDDDEKLLKMSSFVWRHILDEAGPGVALTLWLQVRLRLRQRLWLLTDQ